MKKMPSQRTALSKMNKQQKLISVEELDPRFGIIQEENAAAETTTPRQYEDQQQQHLQQQQISFSPRIQSLQKMQQQYSAADNSSSCSNISPDFKYRLQQQNLQQQLQQQHQRVVSDLDDLQANLKENKEMTIQQGDQTLRIDPSLVNSILRMTLQHQNDFSNQATKKALLKAKSPTKNVSPSNNIDDSATPKMEGFRELIDQSAFDDEDEMDEQYRLELALLNVKNQYSDDGSQQQHNESCSEGIGCGSGKQLSYAMNRDSKPQQMSFAASNDSHSQYQRIRQPQEIIVKSMSISSASSFEKCSQSAKPMPVNAAQEESKVGKLVDSEQEKQEVVLVEEKLSFQSPIDRNQDVKRKNPKITIDTSVLDTPNILHEQHYQQLHHQNHLQPNSGRNLPPFTTPVAIKQNEKEATALLQQQSEVRYSDVSAANLVMLLIDSTEKQKEDQEEDKQHQQSKSGEKVEKADQKYQASLLKVATMKQASDSTRQFVPMVQEIVKNSADDLNTVKPKMQADNTDEDLFQLQQNQDQQTACEKHNNNDKDQTSKIAEEQLFKMPIKVQSQEVKIQDRLRMNPLRLAAQSQFTNTEDTQKVHANYNYAHNLLGNNSCSNSQREKAQGLVIQLDDHPKYPLKHSSSLKMDKDERFDKDSIGLNYVQGKTQAETMFGEEIKTPQFINTIQTSQISPRTNMRLDFTLKPINEEYQPIDNAASTYQGNVENQSMTTSYITLNQTQRQGLTGSSKFTKGDLRPHDMKLSYLDPNNNLMKDVQRPQNSGNALLDKIGLFAYSHGIDPSMFIEKDPLIAQRTLEEQLNSHSSLIQIHKQISERSRSGHQLQELMNQEIRDIRNHLHESQSFSPPFAQTQLQDISMEVDQTTKNFSEMIANSKPRVQFQRRFTQMPQKTKMKNFNITAATEPHLPGHVHESIVNMLKDEIVKNKTQITILSMAHNRYVTKDRQKVSQINRQLRILEQHESKVQEIIDQFKVFKKELHFAFLFASPIVVQQNGGALKFFPQLNFTKEFLKIRDSINAAQVQINITKRQCTTDSLQDILAQMPIGLHFSGHGILNNLEMGRAFFEQNKDQGDFLLLENDKGGSELVSREQLKKMIKQNKCELEFVFVATCHSEFVGKIFQEAGAKHVICIMQSKEVRDDAVLTFTDTFYSMLFEQNKEICVAFSQAQLSVEIGFGYAQAQIFKILRSEDTRDENCSQKLHYSDHHETETVLSARTHHQLGKKLHRCSVFGPFQKGQYNYVEHQYVHLQNKAPKMSKLMGRQKDMFKVIEKIMNTKNSRLFNLIGWPGMGKSALIASVLHYISDRGLLKGGSIYFNARNISMCELFIRNFNQVLISENPTLFGMAREQEQIKHEPIKTLKSILEKIAIIDGDILLVIDNAEEMIINERNDFSMLISMMLTRVSQLKVLLTSQRLLQKSPTFKEEKIVLGNLSNIQSANLFRDVMARAIDQDELNALLKTPIDYTKYPQEQHKMYRKLHDHHLITLLNGNPQSIILTASLLADPQKMLTLKHIYKMLTDQELFKVLAEEGIEESTLVSLRISIQLSFQAIEENDPESVDLLYLLGLLPGGISPKDLDYLWGKVTEQSRKYHIEAKRNQCAAQVSNNSEDQSNSSTRSKKLLQKRMLSQKNCWRRALAELKKGNLAEERKAFSRSYNTYEEQNNNKNKNCLNEQGKSYGDSDDEADELNDETVIILPEIVRNFAEGKLSDLNSVFFLDILSNWYKNQLHSIYIKNENIVLSAQRSSKQRNEVARDFQRLEENLNIFIVHLKDTYREEKFSKLAMTRRNRKKSAQLEDTSDSSSLTEEEELSVAELMFSQQSQNNQAVLPQTGTPDLLRSASDPSNLRKQSLTPKSKKIGDINEAVTQGEEEKNMQTNFPELRDAYFAIKKAQPALEKFIDAMKPTQQIQHPREIYDRDEKAFQYWRWAFEQTKNLQREKKRQNFQEANLKTIGGKTLDESFDSDQSRQFEENLLNFGEQATKNTAELQRVDNRRKLTQYLSNQSLDINNNRLTMRFQRGSIKDPKQPTIQPANAFSRQNNRMSVYECRKNSIIKDKGDLKVDEKVLIYYLINLILYKQFNVANSLIKRHYLDMKQCSNIFKGNFRRLQALSLFLMTTSNQEENSHEVKRHKDAKALSQKQLLTVERCLSRAKKQYKRVNCAWGLGLTYYQQAIVLLHQIQLESAGLKHQRKGSSSLFVEQPRSQTFTALPIAHSQQNHNKFGRLEELTERAKTLFLQAAIKFKDVNHWRGLYMTYRHLELLLRRILSLQQQQSGPPQETADQESQHYTEQIRKYLDFYDVQRYNENQQLIADLTIQRSGGDDLSLMTEIVISRHNTKLFEEPDQSEEEERQQQESQLDFVSEETLSKYKESIEQQSSQGRKGKINIHITELTDDHTEQEQQYQYDNEARANQQIAVTNIYEDHLSDNIDNEQNNFGHLEKFKQMNAKGTLRDSITSTSFEPDRRNYAQSLPYARRTILATTQETTANPAAATSNSMLKRRTNVILPPKRKTETSAFTNSQQFGE